MQFRKSKPYERIFPTVYIGEGRTYASAARKPGTAVRAGSLGVSLLRRSETMDGVLRLTFMLAGLIADSSEYPRSVSGEEFSARLVEDLLDEVGGRCERGRGRSSSE
jgi:hypothetical protein